MQIHVLLCLIVNRLTEAGYQVILSIGEIEENLIGSNCGQYVLNVVEGRENFQDGYTYELRQEAVWNEGSR